MPRSIEVSDAVYAAIENDISGFEETTPNAVLTRWAKERGILSNPLNRNSQKEEPKRTQRATSDFRSRRSSPRRIDGFHLFEVQYDAHRWWHLFIKVSDFLIQKHPNKVEQLLNLRCVHKKEQGLVKAIPIPGTDLFYEANYSAADSIENAHSILKLMGYHPETALRIQEHVASADAINLHR